MKKCGNYAGTNALHGNHQVFMRLFGSSLTGWGLITVSGLLMLLSVSDGLRRPAKLRYHIILQILFFLLYLILAVRVVEVVWSLRAA
jgi:hypothetical protein